MLDNFEIEIKSLLGSRENADKLIGAMKNDGSFLALGSHKQLNHYFIGGDLGKLAHLLHDHIEHDKAHQLTDLAARAKNFSVRTRGADRKVIIVLKITVDDTTSSNGTARLEFESEVEMKLEDLDKLVLSAGFEYQAKWSRERQDFKYKDMNVSIDKNAGYGYLAEFEKVITDASKADETKGYIRNLMSDLEIIELAQDRLERMFAYYNNHWQDYYGTDKIFTID